jgi:8-amino-7-oxononanoate synthase
MKNLAEQLAQRRQQNLYRQRGVLEGPQGVEIRIDGQDCLSFCSNDYLGLANHPQVVEAFHKGLDSYGVGSGAAHLVSGHSRAHHELEEALAAFTGRPRALLFSSGYAANLGVMVALLGRGDRVFEDRANHASLLDGARLSGARLIRYRHADVADLAACMAGVPAGEYLVATDGVFSMDGDIAPLQDIAQACAQQQAWCMVDDAHGFGVAGRHGRGSVDAAGLGIDDVQVLVGTLGKAFGTFGAFVAGCEALVETLIQQARTWIYTTAPPPALACATLAALQRVIQDDWRRERLVTLIRRFRNGARQLDLPLLKSDTPIQPLLVGDAGEALRMSTALREQGILVTAIRPPTVPEDTARLRVTFSALHTDQQVDRLLAALGNVFSTVKQS